MEWVEMAFDKYSHEVSLKPGAKHFLKTLKANGIRAGIATSNNRELLKAVLEAHQLTPYFDCCMTSCEAGAGKPAPDIYLKVAEYLDVTPKECLVFEDIPAGIQAGKSAGMRVCAVSDAYAADRIEKICELADYFIEDYSQVLDGTYRRLD